MIRFGDPRLPTLFWDKVSPEPTSGCWLWIGGHQTAGYGSFAIQRRGKAAHTLTAALAYGPRPEGMETDHRCRVRCCVNPEHLEYVTAKVNAERSPLRMAGKGFADRNRNKTHCAKGHEFSPENTIWATQGGKNGKRLAARRRCRACQKTNYR